jgi:hypothetical protein
MPLLDALLANNIRTIDYECITVDGKMGSPRLVAFGEYAGRSGMINTFRGLGEKFLTMGHSSPFLRYACSTNVHRRRTDRPPSAWAARSSTQTTPPPARP